MLTNMTACARADIQKVGGNLLRGEKKLRLYTGENSFFTGICEMTLKHSLLTTKQHFSC